ncbi:MAG: DUF2130 domain-containing protein [Xanthobacteraceae bacterium]
MNEPTISCPRCNTEIKLNETLAAPLIQATRNEFEQRLAEKESDIAGREAAIREQQDELAKEKQSIDEQVTKKLTTERQRIAAEETKKAKLLASTDLERKSKEIADLQEVLEEREGKLAEAQATQAELMRKQRELDDAKREIDLTVEKRVQESLAVIRDRAKLEAEEELKLKLAEREEKIASMQRQIDDLKRKSEQGSQQLQGEAQELELEAMLRARFPRDLIEPVPKGQFGGDVVHRVMGPCNQLCGSILWESKRTKNWSDAWLPKLREDQRAAKAELALLASSVVPKGVVAFDLVEGVWVTESRYAVSVATVLRQSLIELSSARQAGEGQQSKMELVYSYLTSPRFRHRIEAIVEKISDMQDDLDRERKSMTRLWAKREEQIKGVIESTVGMYGDLQGIVGKALDEIEGLTLPMIEEVVTISVE